jgi:hypothetical protein
MKRSGLNITLLAATMHISESPQRILRQAWCKATRPAEQPVSMDILAPCRSKKWDMRLESTAVPLPVRNEAGRISGSRACSSW